MSALVESCAIPMTPQILTQAKITFILIIIVSVMKKLLMQDIMIP